MATEYHMVFTHKVTGKKVRVELEDYLLSYLGKWTEARERVEFKKPFTAHYDDTEIVLR